MKFKTNFSVKWLKKFNAWSASSSHTSHLSAESVTSYFVNTVNFNWGRVLVMRVVSWRMLVAWVVLWEEWRRSWLVLEENKTMESNQLEKTYAAQTVVKATTSCKMLTKSSKIVLTSVNSPISASQTMVEVK